MESNSTYCRAEINYKENEDDDTISVALCFEEEDDYFSILCVVISTSQKSLTPLTPEEQPQSKDGWKARVYFIKRKDSEKFNLPC